MSSLEIPERSQEPIATDERDLGQPGAADHTAKAKLLNQLTQSKGWRQALGEAYPEMSDYVLRKPVFDKVLPMDGADVLEIGPGFGQFTATIAGRANFVSALEVDEAQAEFIVERLRQDEITNVKVTSGGADCTLPYPPASFDLVVLNLVFEWCAIRFPGGHAEGQQKLLHEIWRVLRPEGRLYLSTKNRFALRYLMRKPDEHYSGMRFGSALPKRIAETLFGRRPPGNLYSWRSLKRMLEETGFGIERSWWAVPDMRECEELIPLDEIRQSRRSVRQGNFRTERLLMSLLPSSLVKHFAPGLTFLAKKKAEPKAITARDA